MTQAYDYGIASINFYNVKNTIEKWHETPNENSLEQYQLAKNSAEIANDYHPKNALYVDMLAQVYEWGVIYEYAEAQQGLSKAKELYLNAAELRPLWPVTWASLVMIKWRQQQFDDEMLYFLKQADFLGPQKPEVNIVYVELGLALYSNNHPLLFEIRETFYQRLTKGLSSSYSRKRVIEIIKQYKAERYVCRWLRNESAQVRSFIPRCK